MSKVVRKPAEFRQACEEARATKRRVGLVPTMGALHDGHFSLLDEAKSRADFIVLTIFVNPLQFAPGEDLERYPRTFESDLAGCRERGVDLVFAPEPNAMYSPAFQTEVSVNRDRQAPRGWVSPVAFRRCDHGRDETVQSRRSQYRDVRPQGLPAMESPFANGPRPRHADRAGRLPHRS